MTGRRPLFMLVALLVIPLPACLHISAQTTSTTPDPTTKTTTKAAPETNPAPPAPLRGEFGTLPKAPGSIVPLKPNAPTTTNPNTTVQKPDPSGPPANPGGVAPAGGAPALLPPFTMPPEAPLLAVVRAYTENKPELAIEIIRKMDKNNQDFVLAVLPILARGATADLTNDPATTAALVDQLRGTIARLESRAALKIEKIAFCSQVDGFGRFEPRSEAIPYKPNERVQLYLELRNLGNQPNGDKFTMRVQAVAEVRDANDKLVAQIQIEGNDHRRVPVVKFERPLETRSPLQDFHMLYGFAAPTVPGVYTVTFQLSDSAGRRTVRSQPAEFRVAGP